MTKSKRLAACLRDEGDQTVIELSKRLGETRANVSGLCGALQRLGCVRVAGKRASEIGRAQNVWTFVRMPGRQGDVLRQPHHREFNGAREKTWKGNAARIRKALEECAKDNAELAAELGLTEHQVKSACRQMAAVQGGVMRSREDPTKWELYEAAKQPRREASARFAGRREIRGYRWGWGMLG